MKHAVISAVCVAAVFLYSIFTMFYVKDFSRQINSCMTSENNVVYTDTDVIKNIYEERKHILTFILNKDHTDELEEIIINLEKSVEYKDNQSIAVNISLLRSALDRIVKSNSFTI